MNYEQRERVTKIMENSKRSHWVMFQMPGIHTYSSNFVDEAHLLDHNANVTRRSLFKFKVKLESYSATLKDTQHLLNFCESLYLNGELTINFKGLDEIADDLYLKLVERYSERDIVIEVGDGECGCRIEYKNLT